ncbi:MAG: DegT/DnrJ/EryC1/StrS aminotransferase family protein, partial [Candidatus Latescibacteria bacterium]|nr:DegT/DnrJ/EryC1/StrS aminotransferase family protein [Candidatus Latescibacterota bacterium]
MIPHSKPLLDEHDIAAVDSVLESGMLTSGDTVRAFESAVCSFLGRRHAAAVSSGTAALYTVLSALGAGRGGEIVIPSYACSSLLYAVRLTGAKPVVADSGEDPFHCDAASVGRILSGKTKAVVFPHLFGSAVDIAGIVALGVPVIEDCAMSLGSKRRGTMSGGLGSAAAILSFYTTKVIAAGEGGMVVSDDARLVEKVRDMADYADKVDDSMRFNFTMTDLAAALGLSQLGKIESLIDRRRMLARRYTDALA